jgi:hypothetical protein
LVLAMHSVESTRSCGRPFALAAKGRSLPCSAWAGRALAYAIPMHRYGPSIATGRLAAPDQIADPVLFHLPHALYIPALTCKLMAKLSTFPVCRRPNRALIARR